VRRPWRAAALAWLAPLSPTSDGRTWRRALAPVAGALPARGPRTVAPALRAVGLGAAPGFGSYHRVPSRRRWCGRAVARVLLAELLRAFAPGEPVAVAPGETLERRRGRRIAARGIHRGPARPPHGHFAKAGGLRRFTPALLAPVPWASRARAPPAVPDRSGALGAARPRAWDAGGARS
jgi:hypothetical protein